ncbi:MAG: gluconeogenesis factor YvcK family protein [Bacteroidales bacterium]
MSKIRKKTHPNSCKKIVCFAGGSVVPKIILKPFKDLGFDMVGITSMVDNGGSTGALRKDLGVLPTGDIRRHLLALSDLTKGEEWKEKLWNFRFGKTEISPGHFGHNFANFFMSGLECVLGDFEKSLKITSQFLNVKGRALPVTLDNIQLVAELEDGSLVRGEDEIDVGKNHNRDSSIKKIYLNPGGRVYPKAKKEIKSADFIIIGPGDLYSSLLPCFLAEGATEAVSKSKAKKIFICPAMTKNGETSGFSVNKFCQEVEKYINCPLDFVIYNNVYPGNDRVAEYKKQGEFLDELLVAEDGLNKGKFIGADVLTSSGLIVHDSKKLIKVIKKICKL